MSETEQDLRDGKPEILQLTVSERTQTGKKFTKKMRRPSQGRVFGTTPGVVYSSAKGPRLIQFDTGAAIKFLNKVKGVTKIVNLLDESTQQLIPVIVKDHQINNSRKLLHVDFWEVTPETVIKTFAGLNLVGVPKAVKFGGVMQVIRRNIEIECEVRHLPDSIPVDVNQLNFGESIHVEDIPYPEGVKPVVKGRNFTLVTVTGRAPEATDESAEGEE